MGWFSFGSSGPKSTTASDGGRIAPDRSSREQCYQARNLFFTCLDKNDILDAIKSNEDVRHNCAKELAAFETTCSKTWVKYFKEKRVMEYNRDKTIERIKKEDAAMAAAQRGASGQ